MIIFISALILLEVINLIIIKSLKSRLKHDVEQEILKKTITIKNMSSQFDTLQKELKTLLDEKTKLEKLVEEERSNSKMTIDSMSENYSILVENLKAKIKKLEAGR
jgi:flagellar biosynthesis chaperone FliJ